MEWRIRKDSRTGEYIADYGGEVEPHAVGDGRPGFYMRVFIVYFSSRFKTERQAKEYIKKHPKGR